MPSLGPLELVVVMVVALMVFGPKRLPEVGRQVGKGLRELRKLQDTIRDEMNDIMHSVDTPPVPTTPAGPETTRTATPALTSGRNAPSRYRPAIVAPVVNSSSAAPSDPATVASPEPARRGMPAPSKFRAPRA